MKHRLCLIDNDFPAELFPDFINETRILDQAVLRFLIINGSWKDETLKQLTENVLSDSDNWIVSGFKNPSFYFNHCSEEIYSPEIIIYDWDYGDGPGSTKSEDDLLEILGDTYAVINIFTGADKDQEVSQVIDGAKFEKYRDRIRLIKKDDENCHTSVLETARERLQSNFSFKFGRELKQNAINSLDEILVKIAKLKFDEFVKLFGDVENNESVISIHDFTEIIVEKFRSELLKQNFSSHTFSVPNRPQDQAIPADIVKELWAFRLYHFPNDDIVRTGDIIAKNGESDETLYLVLSANCNLNKFWKKNLGYITLIPLHKIFQQHPSLLRKLNYHNSPAKLRDLGASSISNPINIDSVSILPCFPINTRDDQGIRRTQHYDYIVAPREIISFEVGAPQLEAGKSIREVRLTYSLLQDFDGNERKRVSEPFLTPLLQFILNSITGYGAPDYPKQLKDLIKGGFAEIFQ